MEKSHAELKHSAKTLPPEHIASSSVQHRQGCVESSIASTEAVAYRLDQDVISGFQDVIKKYKSYYQNGMPMPSHRMNEVAEIEKLLTQSMTHEELHIAIRRLVDKMWTGWVVGTVEVFAWNSRLKPELEKLLSHTYQLEDMKKRDEIQNKIRLRIVEDSNTVIKELKIKVRALEDDKTAQADIIEIQDGIIHEQEEIIGQFEQYKKSTSDYLDLRKQCAEQKIKIESLETTVNQHSAKIKALRTQKRLLQDKNNQLKEENKNLQTELDKIEKNKESNDHGRSSSSSYSSSQSSFF